MNSVSVAPTRFEAANSDEWRDVVAQTVYPLAVQATSTEFSGSITQQMLSSSVKIGEVYTDAVDLVRTPRLLKEAPTDDVLMLIHLEGHGQAIQHDRYIRMGAGGATFLDPTREYRVSSEQGAHQMVVVLPRSAMHGFEKSFGDFTALPVDASSAALQCIRSLLSTILVCTDSSTPLESEAIAGAIADLARTALATSVDPAGAEARTDDALDLLAREFIRGNLRDPNLSPDTVAAALGVSPRRLGVAMQHHQPPASYIRTERLRAARQELLDEGTMTRSIADIAYSWGFGDATTFTRAFRRYFGERPSDIRPPVG